MVIIGPVGAEIVRTVVAEHNFASVAVMVYVPGPAGNGVPGDTAIPLMSKVNVDGVGYGAGGGIVSKRPIPPVPEKTMLEVPPKQVIGEALALTVTGGAWPKFTYAVYKHPLSSSIFTW